MQTVIFQDRNRGERGNPHPPLYANVQLHTIFVMFGRHSSRMSIGYSTLKHLSFQTIIWRARQSSSTLISKCFNTIFLIFRRHSSTRMSIGYSKRKHLIFQTVIWRDVWASEVILIHPYKIS